MTMPPTSQPLAARPVAGADVVGPPASPAAARTKRRPTSGRPITVLTVA